MAPSLALPHKGGGYAFARKLARGSGFGLGSASDAGDRIERFSARTKVRVFSRHRLPPPDRNVDRRKSRGVAFVPADEAMGAERPGVARARHPGAPLVGGVGELLCNVFDREGRIIDHPLNQRVMSVPIEAVRAAPIRVLAAGGAHKVAALEGAIRLLNPTALVTDETTARALTGGAG